MPLGVNQNLAAQGVLIQLQNNDKIYKRQIDRLSSGLRINTAADDPAGLVISEKYKLQTDGLGQAIKNAQDGISLTQTAEGALQEVTNQLRTMRNLALHAANTGPNDTAAIQADQNQITSAIATINRIASTTQFGTRKLLDGSSGVSGSTTNSNVTFITGSSNTAGGTYAVNVTQAARQGAVQSASGLTVASSSTAGSANTATSAGALTFSGSLVGASAVVVSTSVGDNGATIATRINNDSSLAAAGISATWSGNTLVVTSDRLSGGGAAELSLQASTTEIGGITGVSSAATTAATTAAATDTARIRNSEILTFSNGTGTSVQVTLTAGSTIRSSVTALQAALDDSNIKINAAYNNTTHGFTFTNREYGSSSTIKNTIQSNLTGTAAGGNINTNVVLTQGTNYTLASSTLANGTDGLDVMGTIGGLNATGVGQFLTGNSGTAVDGLEVKVTATAAQVAASNAFGNVTVNQNSMTFQIGAFANQTVELTINDLRANMLGTTTTGTSASTTTIDVASIDVTKGAGAGAQDAIMILDNASSQISSLRASLGSFQKDTLESSVRNMMVAQQNIQTSQSQITDANMAEETLTYSRSQILQQTGLAMLTQANQAPQQLLSLVKG